MNPATILREARADGVAIRLSTDGNIKVRGSPQAVARWTPTLREHKRLIVAELSAPGGPIFAAWAETAGKLCDLRGDADSEHRLALLNDYTNLEPQSRAAWLDVFRAEIAAITAVREATA